MFIDCGVWCVVSAVAVACVVCSVFRLWWWVVAACVVVVLVAVVVVDVEVASCVD